MDSPSRNGSSPPPPSDGPRIFEFGRFEFDEERWELRAGGSAVDVPPKVMQTLALLLRNRERLVPTEELLQALWPNVTVTEASLTKAIRIARQVLQDDGEAQRCIRTTRGRGYRFVADVVERPPVRRASVAPSAPPPPLLAARPLVVPGDEPFVGRDAELAELLAVLERARGGKPGFVLVSGAAGVGKTRLLDEFARRAELASVPVFWGRAWEEGGAPDLWPWIQILRGLLSSSALAPEDADEVSAVLAAVVASGSGETRTGPERFRAFDAIVSVLTRLGRAAPLVLVLEDLHASDASTLTLARFLVRDIRDAGVLVLGTYRAGEVLADPLVGEPFRKLVGSARVVPLDGLGADSTERLIRAVAGSAPSPALVGKVQRATEGNPLFVVEIARKIAAGGVPADGEDMDIPERIVEAVRSRLDALPERTRELLGVASVIGRNFELPVLMRVTGLRKEELVRFLAPALERGILSEVRGALGTLAFSHMVLRDVPYEALAVAERAALHARIGEVLEASGAPGTELPVARLSHHFLRASLGEFSEEAVRYSEAAGRQALRSFAFEEAVRHFEHALGALRFASDERARSTDLLLSLARAQRLSGDYSSAGISLGRALAVARTLEDPVRFARVALDHGEIRPESGLANDALIPLLTEASQNLPEADGDAEILELRTLLEARLATGLSFAGRRAEASTLAESALVGARALGRTSVLGQALYAKHWVLWRPGTARERLAIAEEIIRLDRGGEESPTTMEARLCEITDLLELGEAAGLSRALQRYERGAELQREPSYLYNVRLFRAMRALLEGRLEEAEQISDEALLVGSRIHPENAANFYGAHLWWLRIEQGRGAEMEPLFRARLEADPENVLFRVGLLRLAAESGDVETTRSELAFVAERDFARLPTDWALLPSLAHVATGCALTGDRRLAAEVRRLLLPFLGTQVVLGPAIVYLGPASYYAGLCAHAAGAVEDALGDLEQARAEADRLGAAPFARRAELARGRALAELGADVSAPPR
ncbi:MAG TPA: AAA family ATPase [Polyangiaceae bacterium]|nr:AAA family ATPase [Polyangiaceae bacterium]